ncbi:unnamed protein product [Pedinophyceae sp. YPF-701]|nr:unnamed protein product [Pedinophyceae sp. YPF-701]
MDSHLPVVDLAPLVDCEDFTSEAVQDTCKQIASCIVRTGCLLVRDPRVGQGDSDVFLDTMERYFAQPPEVKQADARPDLAYQVGVTPEGVEIPRAAVDPACLAGAASLPQEHRPSPCNGPDPKWRFLWGVGPRPDTTAYPHLNSKEQVVPAAFPEWRAVMDAWGTKMLAAVHTAARGLAVGLGLAPTALTDFMERGPHLLAPTGCDLSRHNAPGTVFAGFHYDMNLLTIHGRSRYPGLHAWLRDGRRVPVVVPPGCLLLQAGRQLEWLTAGAAAAGFHEVVLTEATQEAMRRAEAEGRPLWRVSSTVFAHVASDRALEPLMSAEGAAAARAAHGVPAGARGVGEREEYPRTLAGEYVDSELAVIALSRQRAKEKEKPEAGDA